MGRKRLMELTEALEFEEWIHRIIATLAHMEMVFRYLPEGQFHCRPQLGLAVHFYLTLEPNEWVYGCPIAITIDGRRLTGGVYVGLYNGEVVKARIAFGADESELVSKATRSVCDSEDLSDIAVRFLKTYSQRSYSREWHGKEIPKEPAWSRES